MKIYGLLSKIPFLKRYSFKFLFVAFLGIHIPLLAVIGFILMKETETISSLQVFLLVLGFTLFATAVTLFMLNGLLAPLIQTKNSLEAYAREGKLPNLPSSFEDEAGILMRDVQNTVTKSEKMLATQKGLTSLLSHDLRSPLAEMIGVSQVLDLAKSEEERSFMIRQVTNSGNMMLEMLESILTLMKLETMDTDSLPKQQKFLKPLLNASILQLQNSIDQKSVTIHIDIPEDLEVHVNETAFSRALTNLIHNALKFSYKKGKIHISAQVLKAFTEITIEDSGIGLEPGTEKQIFTQFTKHGRPGTENEKSTGLGLFLTKEIIELHQGKIYAASEGKNQGTTFAIELPNQTV